MHLTKKPLKYMKKKFIELHYFIKLFPVIFWSDEAHQEADFSERVLICSIYWIIAWSKLLFLSLVYWMAAWLGIIFWFIFFNNFDNAATQLPFLYCFWEVKCSWNSVAFVSYFIILPRVSDDLFLCFNVS